MAKRVPNPDKNIAYLKYINREAGFEHSPQEEDMKQFRLMQSGDMAAVKESARMMRRNHVCNLSKDSVEDLKFLFVACVTLTSRFAAEGGLSSETSYNASDLYISRLSECRTEEDIFALHAEMMAFYTTHMAELKKDNIYSRSVLQCIDYIEHHLHEQLKVEVLADAVALNPSYLSTLFKKETGVSLSEYIMRERIETSKNMLLYSGFTSAYISEVLAFSSQSHFIRSFRRFEGMTPREFQEKHFRDGLGKREGELSSE